jgi:uncharacterized protein YidB (DUF937 family)
MIDNLLKLANGGLANLLENVGENRGSTDTVRETFLELIQEKAKSGDFGAIEEMFSGSETSTESPAVSNLKSDLANSLSQKLGIDTDKALALAAQALPFLLNIFNQKVSNSSMPKEDLISSVIKSFQGENSSGLGGMLSSIFGSDDDPKAIDLGDVVDLGIDLFKKKKK